jgi:hypothetical protein
MQFGGSATFYRGAIQCIEQACEIRDIIGKTIPRLSSWVKEWSCCNTGEKRVADFGEGISKLKR